MDMKYLYFLFVVFPFLAVAQNGQLGAFLQADIPDHTIMPKMSTNFGIGIQGGYQPFDHLPVVPEFKASIGTYSHRTLQQTYIFDSTNSTTTDVTYSSAMNRMSFGTKVYLTHQYRAVRPFITPQVGMAFMRSRIVIADPQDEDDCKPLDRKTTQRHSGFTYGGEAGVEIALDRLSGNGATGESRHKLYASVSFMQSFQPFEYVNVKYMQDHDHSAMAPGENHSSMSSDGREINTTFINVSTQNIHEHKIAELYRTQLRFWSIGIGYVYHFK